MTTILSFLGCLQIAVNIVKSKYPNAELYNVYARSSSPNPLYATTQLNELTVTFRVEDKTGDAGHVVIRSIPELWGEFAPLTYYPGGIIGNNNIPLPIALPLHEAWMLVVRAGYRMPFFNMALTEPQHAQPGQKVEPLYTFTLLNGTQVSVGTNSRAVFPLPPKAENEAILSWLGNINIGVNIVRKEFPGAELYLVKARPTFPDPITNPAMLTNITLAFRVDKGHVLIHSKSGFLHWGEWYQPVYYDSHVIGPGTIDWPVKMGVKEAYELVLKEGYRQPFFTVSIGSPLYPGEKETFYHFVMLSGKVVSVNIRTGQVTPPLLQQ